MLGDAPIMAFASAVDLGRARSFYEGVLGLTMVEMNDFACVLRAGGVTLRITRVESLTPQPFTVLGWEVIDI
jgi:catechol-2,3-dioxygenase